MSFAEILFFITVAKNASSFEDLIAFCIQKLIRMYEAAKNQSQMN
jgi:hypothetical protein